MPMSHFMPIVDFNYASSYCMPIHFCVRMVFSRTVKNVSVSVARELAQHGGTPGWV